LSVEVHVRHDGHCHGGDHENCGDGNQSSQDV
jgi:hypothetical protein